MRPEAVALRLARRLPVAALAVALAALPAETFLGAAAAQDAAPSSGEAQRAVELRADVADAAVGHDGQAEVRIRLDPASAKIFSAFSNRHVGRRIEIAFDGKVVSAPVLQTPITGGRIIVSQRAPSFGLPEAGRLAERLRSGETLVVRATD